ncbi:MAG TPA: hypothetical protein VGI40_22895 [Pirellulaceae bacterium]
MHGPSHVNFPMVVVCTLATAACWGVYGPLLQWGHGAMGTGRLRPFICVGIAYVIIAIVGPILLMTITGMESESGLTHGWTDKSGSGIRGIFWSLMGGSAGALGALGVILALNYGGQPGYVMPVVFGCAPVINTAFTMYFAGTYKNLEPVRGGLYFAGLLLVVMGASLVLLFAPKPAPKKSPEAAKPVIAKHATEAKT